MGWDGGLTHKAVPFRRGGREVPNGIQPTESDNARIIRFRFPRRLLHASKHVRWRVIVDSTMSADETAVDQAPNAGWFVH